MSLFPPEQTAPPTQCSAKGCRRAASYAIRWRNPKIHTEDRRKTWLACDEHRVTLSGFLSMRSFPLEVVPIEDLPADR